MDKKYCLEIMVIKDPVSQVQKMADEIKALKSVMFGELVIAKPVK